MTDDRRPAAIADEDVRLWRQVMRDVRPLPGRALPPEPATPVTVPPPASAPATLAAPLPRRPLHPVPLPAARHAPVPGLDSSNARRLRRGQLQVEARLDLHGMDRERAHLALNHFLGVSQQLDRRTVLVITGKGSGPGGAGSDAGILRRAVPRWLHEGVNRERVLAYTAARPQHGGDGALYVLLRRRRA